MTVELIDLSCDFNNKLYDEDLPLPIFCTEEIMSHMPDGKWQIPQEPYTVLHKIFKDDSSTTKIRKRESFQANCREVITKWVIYLDSVEKGWQIFEKAVNEKIQSVDIPSTQAFISFYNIMKQRPIENAETDVQETVNSCRNAFLCLLTTEEAEKMGYDKPKTSTEKDIKNAMFLVEGIARRHRTISQ